MKPFDLTNIEEMGNSSFRTLPAGGYVCIITGAKSNDNDKYIEITYDIYEGDYKKFYSDDEYSQQNPWTHTFRSYWKDKAAGMFKHFLSCIDKSNGTNFVDKCKVGFADAELNKRLIGLVFREEEYMSNKGEIRTRIRQHSCYTIEEIRQGNFKVPELKKFERIEKPESDPAAFIDAGTETSLPTEW